MSTIYILFFIKRSILVFLHKMAVQSTDAAPALKEKTKKI